MSKPKRDPDFTIKCTLAWSEDSYRTATYWIPEGIREIQINEMPEDGVIEIINIDKLETICRNSFFINSRVHGDAMRFLEALNNYRAEQILLGEL